MRCSGSVLIALIQRVSHAGVVVEGQTVGSIGKGMLALIGVEKSDSEVQLAKLAAKMLNYRMFADQQDKMNLNLMQVKGELLLVPQFTLAADTRSGLRPSFQGAAPDVASALFDSLLTLISEEYIAPQAGIFGANMQVSLCNDGPVTFWLQVE